MLHFYDQQLRRYLLQFVRIFGSFTIQKGFDQTGYPVYEKVPARYGDMSRQVGHILKGNSENTMNSVPFISCYVNSLDMNPDLRRYPQFEDTLKVIEKKFDQNQHAYINEPGQSFNVTRYQPVPYKLTMTVDIWTSNTDQKLQLLEQILVLFNPGINLHTTQNPVDWTSLTYCELTNTNWTNRSLPGGVDNTIDISTLTFEMPIFINPPVKVQRMNIIQTILTQLHTLDLEDFENWTVNTSTGAESNFVIVTLEDYWVRYENGVATLIDNRKNSGSLSWKEDVFGAYGELRPGISQIRFRQGGDVTDPSNDIIGTLDYDPSDPAQLLVSLDVSTLPSNTQPAVTAIINPQNNYPGDGILGVSTVGNRYLILDQLPINSYWGGLQADKNDIIEYNGSTWVVSFDASANSSVQFVTNLTSGDQFEWTGDYWQNSSEGVYRQCWVRLYV
jgi:T4-like virus Myoviridae tail sheath stabiliser